MTLSIVDTHAHLDMDSFSGDRPEVLARALDSGVGKIITVGIDLESSKKAIKLAEDNAGLFATVGFHPHDAIGVNEQDIAELGRIADHPRVVAAGEMGLDFYRNRSPRDAQLQVFQWQLELAVKLELPVIIHCRQAEDDMLTILHDWTSCHAAPEGRPRGVIHCFNGDTNTARQYLEMEFFIALGAYVSYPSSLPMYDAIRSIPEDRLVVETDCPFLPPQNLRGERNEPSYLPLTVASLAEIRKTTPETIAAKTTENAHRLFRLPGSVTGGATESE